MSKEFVCPECLAQCSTDAKRRPKCNNKECPSCGTPMERKEKSDG